MGLKAMSALADSPGINSRSVAAPINQNGMKSAKTSRKNFSGDLPSDGKAAKEALRSVMWGP